MPRKWSQEQREEKSSEVKQWQAKHGHPATGRHHAAESVAAMRKKKNRPTQLGNCIICGRPIYNPESAKRGMGPKCAGLA